MSAGSRLLRSRRAFVAHDVTASAWATFRSESPDVAALARMRSRSVHEVATSLGVQLPIAEDQRAIIARYILLDLGYEGVMTCRSRDVADALIQQLYDAGFALVSNLKLADLASYFEEE